MDPEGAGELMAIAKWARGGAWGACAIYGCVQTVTSLVCKGRYYCEKCKGWHRVTTGTPKEPQP